jgi:hypothetical protein
MLSWVRKQEHLDPAVRIALEGLLKRWRKRADDVVVDWAELLTDPVALAAGLRRLRRRQPARPRQGGGVGQAADRRAGQAGGRRRRRRGAWPPTARRSASTTTIRRAGSTTRTTRCSCG